MSQNIQKGGCAKTERRIKKATLLRFINVTMLFPAHSAMFYWPPCLRASAATLLTFTLSADLCSHTPDLPPCYHLGLSWGHTSRGTGAQTLPLTQTPGEESGITPAQVSTRASQRTPQRSLLGGMGDGGWRVEWWGGQAAYSLPRLTSPELGWGWG